MSLPRRLLRVYFLGLVVVFSWCFGLANVQAANACYRPMKWSWCGAETGSDGNTSGLFICVIYTVDSTGYPGGYSVVQEHLTRCQTNNSCTDLPACSDAPAKPKNLGASCSPDNNAESCGRKSGNPIDNTTGNKTQRESDYSGAGVFPLRLVRHYNSQSTISTGALGANWTHEYGSHIDSLSATEVNIVRGDETTFSFMLVNGVWQAEADVNSKLVPLLDSAGHAAGWRYTTVLENQESYDVQGRLISVTNRAGLKQTFRYDAAGRLITVIDPFGRQLAFAYDAQNRISTATDPLGNQYGYHYDANNNLDSVTYPDGAVRQYRYENSQLPHALTGIIDENGTRFATWSYEGDRAVSSEHAGGVEKVTLSMDTSNLTASVHDALGATHQYACQTYLGVAHTVSETRSCPNCVSNTRTMSYDDQGNMMTSTDFNGNTTQYSYDTARNLEISRTEAVGKPEARVITTQWHSSFRLPIHITRPDGSETFAYNAKGLLIKRTVSSTDGQQSRAWSYAYNANGQLTQVDGPRTDVTDVINYAYDAQGNLLSVTNALGHITRITNYDTAGHPLRIVDPNGLVTTLSYDSRGRIITKDNGGEVTRTVMIKQGCCWQ